MQNLSTTAQLNNDKFGARLLPLVSFTYKLCKYEVY